MIKDNMIGSGLVKENTMMATDVNILEIFNMELMNRIVEVVSTTPTTSTSLKYIIREIGA